MTELNSKVYLSLIRHLQERPEIQNIDLMLAGGFCRNCLAKWRHAANRTPGATYEDSIREVYGMSYEEWKSKYQSKADEEKLRQFEIIKGNGFHATYEGFDPKPVPSTSFASDACCDTIETDNSNCEPSLGGERKRARVSGTRKLRIATLTCSDRASRGEYREDLSGSTIVKTLEDKCPFEFEIVRSKIVPDEIDLIEKSLRELLDVEEEKTEEEEDVETQRTIDVILTTGGTGISDRDVTPEATLKVLTKRLPGIGEAMRRETAKVEPLALLTRAEAGIARRGGGNRKTRALIVNLPGNPNAVKQCLEAVVFPLLPRIVKLMVDDVL